MFGLKRDRTPTFDTGEAPPHWPLGLAAATAIVVVVLVGGGLALTAFGPGRRNAPSAGMPPAGGVSQSSSPSPGSPDNSSSPVPGSGSAEAMEVLQLPKPTTVTQGVPTGFPHSMAGAVAAAYYDTQALGSTLNPDRAATIARVVAAPSWVGAADQAAQGSQATRVGIGLTPTVQGNDGGAAAALTAADYQLRDTSDDAVSVLLLCTYSAYNPTHPSSDASGVLTESITMSWSGSDWQMNQPSDISSEEQKRLSVNPTDPTAADLGWRDLRV